MEDMFSARHPAVLFLFFAGAIVGGMFFVHPFFLGISAFSAALYYWLLTGRKGVAFLLSLFGVAVCLSILNPLLNTQGETALFSYSLSYGIARCPGGVPYLSGRVFTLESLLYGIATGGVFFTMLLWFACYQRVMDSDKFLYLFGRALPAVSLLLSIVLRLTHQLKRKAGLIAQCRACIGRAPGSKSKGAGVSHAAAVLSMLTSWSLEGAVTMADSMKSRGYGSGSRSVFSLYRFGRRDFGVCAVLAISAGFVVAAAFLGRTGMVYQPSFQMPKTDAVTVAGALGYGFFLLLPSALHIWEDVTWNISKSKI